MASHHTVEEAEAEDSAAARSLTVVEVATDLEVALVVLSHMATKVLETKVHTVEVAEEVVLLLGVVLDTKAPIVEVEEGVVLHLEAEEEALEENLEEQDPAHSAPPAPRVRVPRAGVSPTPPAHRTPRAVVWSVEAEVPSPVRNLPAALPVVPVAGEAMVAAEVRARARRKREVLLLVDRVHLC